MTAATLKTWLLSATPLRLRPYWDRLEASPLGCRLARGAFWSLAGAMISRGLGLVASIFVARILGKVGFGELGIIQSTIGMFATFAGFGLGLTATKHVAEFRSTDPERAGRIIGLSSAVSWVTGSLMAVMLYVLSDWLAARTLAAPHLAPMLRLGSLLLLLGAVNGAQTGALSGFEAFKSIARINLISGLATLPVMLVGTWWAGLKGAICALLLAQSLNCLLNYCALVKESRRSAVPLGWGGAAREGSILWRFSVPALASNLLVAPVYWVANTLLVNGPDGYGQMGIFNAANQWFGVLLFLPGVLGQAVLPMLSETIGRDARRSRKLLVSSMKLNAAALSPLILLGSIASPLIMASYGPGFRQAWPTLVVVLITAGLLAVQTPVGQIIAASGRMWLGTLMNLGWAAAFVSSAWLILGMGAFGLASSRLIAYLAHGAWTLGFAAYLLRKHPRDVTAFGNANTNP